MFSEEGEIKEYHSFFDQLEENAQTCQLSTGGNWRSIDEIDDELEGELCEGLE